MKLYAFLHVIFSGFDHLEIAALEDIIESYR